MSRAEDPAHIPTATLDELTDLARLGVVTTLLDGTIVQVSPLVERWIGLSADDLVGRRRLPDLLRVGGRIYYETHYAPLLDIQGHVEDVALDLIGADGGAVPVVASSCAVAASDGVPAHVRTVLVHQGGRRDYERELVRARHRAEELAGRASAVARTLQRSLLQGAAASGPGFVVEARYRPGVETLEVGGDWYDAVPLDDATVAVAVGDVVGRGLSAAVAMGHLRSAARALAGTRIGPARVLDELDRFVGGVPGAWMATVALAEVEPATRRVTFSSAGHLPILVVEPDGTTEYLWGGRATPLAAVDVAGPRPEATTTVPEGARLVLFTDGLIERSGRDIDVGLDAVALSAAGLSHADPATMVDRMMADLLADEDVHDDVCLLCVALT